MYIYTLCLKQTRIRNYDMNLMIQQQINKKNICSPHILPSNLEVFMVFAKAYNLILFFF